MQDGQFIKKKKNLNASWALNMGGSDNPLMLFLFFTPVLGGIN